jgi:hypothetical protein
MKHEAHPAPRLGRPHRLHNIVGGPSSRLQRRPIWTTPEGTPRETPSGRWNGRVHWSEGNRVWNGKAFDSGSHRWVSSKRR